MGTPHSVRNPSDCQCNVAMTLCNLIKAVDNIPPEPEQRENLISGLVEKACQEHGADANTDGKIALSMIASSL